MQRSPNSIVQKIALVNHMGLGNLGDDATQDAVMQNIRNRWPNAEIILFSMNPADTRSRHGVPSYPIRTEFWKRGESRVNGSPTARAKVKNALRKHALIFQLLRAIKTATIRVPGRLFDELQFLFMSFRIIKSFDLLIISGGGQLLDSWGGPWKFPYTVFKWTLLGRLSGAKCYFLNVGAGPLDDRLAQWFIRNAVRLADYVSFRDEDSRVLIQKIGFPGETRVSADCVYALNPPTNQSRGLATRPEPIVGLSPMAYCDPRRYWLTDQAVYESYIHTLGAFGSRLIRHGYRLALFSTEISFDAWAIEDLRAALEAEKSMRLQIVQESITGVQELLSQMSSMDYIVTCRFHGVVFAHLLNKPVLAISHHPKVSTLMKDLGLERYCVDIRECGVDQLEDSFLSLVANGDEIRSRMADKLGRYRTNVSVQFDQLFPPGESHGLNSGLHK